MINWGWIIFLFLAMGKKRKTAKKESLKQKVASVAPNVSAQVTNGPRTMLIVILIVLFVAATGGFAWSYWKYQQVQKEIAKLATLEGQQELTKKQVQEIIKKESLLIVVPEKEEPIVATIIDVKSLSKDQPFYKDAKNGDKLIIYPKAKKAIIYDPDRNILVNVGPIYLQDQSTDGLQQMDGNSEGAEGEKSSGNNSDGSAEDKEPDERGSDSDSDEPTGDGSNGDGASDGL